MRRPALIPIFGTLSLLFATIGMVGDVRAVLGQILHPRAAHAESLAAAGPSPVQQMIFAGMLLLGILATLALAAAGVGLLKRKPWGRSLAIGYSLYVIAAAPATLAMQYLWVVSPAFVHAAALSPHYEHLLRQELTRQMAWAVLATAASLAFPLALLAAMLRRSVIDALAEPQWDSSHEAQCVPFPSPAQRQRIRRAA